MKSIDHLRALVSGLDSASISSWQSTEKWQKQLDAARDFIAQNKFEEDLQDKLKELKEENSALRESIYESYQTIHFYQRICKAQRDFINLLESKKGK